MIAGAAFAVLYATAVVGLHALPGADPGVTRMQALLLTFAALALAVVLAFARDRLRGPPAYLFTIGSTLLVAQLCVAVWFAGGLSLRPGQTAVATARAIEDVGTMWLPVATIANILVAAPILMHANEGRLPRWLGIIAAVFTVEQLIETITVIGPPGSFISPGGPMNHYFGVCCRWPSSPDSGSRSPGRPRRTQPPPPRTPTTPKRPPTTPKWLTTSENP